MPESVIEIVDADDVMFLEEVFEAIETASLPAGIHTITFSMPIFAEVCKEFREKKGEIHRPR